MRQALGVLDQGRPSVDAAMPNRVQRHERRHRRTAVQLADDRRRLPGQVALGGDGHHDGDRIELTPTAQGDRRLDGPGELLSYVDDGGTRSEGHARGHESVEHQVRRLREQQRILGAGRFAFGTIGNDDRSRPPVASDRAPLDVDRGPGAAVADQPAGLHLSDQVVTSSLPVDRPPAVGVGIESHRWVARPQAGHQPRQSLRLNRP